MNYLIGFIVISSYFIALLNGRMNELSSAIISECSNAVTLSITLCGSLCLWGGIMNIAEKSGIVKTLSLLLKPIFKQLFPNLKSNSKAAGYITLNFISNLLGLGNASTPIGIKAMEELKKEDNANIYASDNMIMLTVLNTAALQLFPATIITLRAKYGSNTPTDIIPAVWGVSAITLCITIIAVKIFASISKKKARK